MQKIIYFESPANGIARALKGRGYVAAGYFGIRNKPATNLVGVLKERKPIQKTRFGFKLNKTQRAHYIGDILLNSSGEEEQWLLKGYGKKYFPKLTEILEEISESYGAKLQVRLDRKTPKQETYLSDFTNPKNLSNFRIKY
ncbi:MAG: hypothetical protein NTZ83_02030 [Candidatus Pacearchaeota archaeon]|nr:hypothetical protein [Candidatus Pacearchaeota archaeon]